MSQPNKAWRQHPIPQLVLTRLIEFTREPQALFWVYFFPLLMAFSLGIAFREQPQNTLKLKVGIAPDSGTEVPAWLANLEGMETKTGTLAECLDLLRRGRLDAVVEVKPDAVQPLVTHTDPTRQESTLARFQLDAAREKSIHPDSSPLPVAPLDLGGLRYIDFLVPGLLGVNLMGGGLWGVGFALVDLRVRKLLKRFAATPMRVGDLLTSLAISRFLFTLGQVLLLLGASWLAFGVTVRGSLLDFVVLLALGGFCFLSIGLLVASRVTTYEAVNGIMNLVMLPMYVFSGVFFSAERFPEFMAPLIKILPLTALNDSLRAVMNDGRSLFSLIPEMLVLLVWTGVSLVLAIRLFKWR